jgi:hypothetical protein
MSVATIERVAPSAAVDVHDIDIVDFTIWMNRSASLRRPFTAIATYQPRHRALGPAL